jgi:antirestriction protein ArdC
MDVTTEISPSEAGTILTIDLEAIVANWQTLQMVCGNEPRADHAKYLVSWLANLKADKKAISAASAVASKAS